MEFKVGYLYRAYYSSWWVHGNITPTVELRFDELKIVGVTPKGTWIVGGQLSKPKWVSDNARKRYAYPTRELAINSLSHRLDGRLKHLRTAMSVNKEARANIAGLTR